MLTSILALVLAQQQASNPIYMTFAQYPAQSMLEDTKALGGFAVSNHAAAVADKGTVPAGKLAVQLKRLPSSIEVRIVNGTSSPFWFDAADSNILGWMEARDEDGEWAPIEYFNWISCGNSYHRVALKTGYQWKYSRPMPAGGPKTRVRWRSIVAGKEIFSNELTANILLTRFQLDPETKKSFRLDTKARPTLYPLDLRPPEILETSTLKVVGENLGFTEGPCWVGNRFLFCSWGKQGILSFDPATGAIVPALESAPKSIGIATDGKGSIFVASAQSKNIRKFAIKDGKLAGEQVIASGFEGKKLVATNDLAVGPDGTVYFTDPFLINRPESDSVPKMGVYSVNKSGKIEILTTDVNQPNGIAFKSNVLYIAEYATNKIKKFDLKSRKLSEFVDLATVAKENGISGPGQADGIRFDNRGNLYSTGPGGVYVISPEGSFMDHLPLARSTNLAFGGADGKLLLLTQSGSISTVRCQFAGAGF
ncbi:MAG: SMP-30/gluconolactonase/LRE family protein [Armatimonadetes bacterium]|nr:SMP-30/gluconolactonase/LRE family protein [Armatimonadota bacterium]